MSLKYHPDKCTKEPLNLPEAKCKDMFIMVRKAYETLTDEQTKDNYEKYGNPDGYKGTSVTIGLPSWLTHKDNELAILSVYFFALIILVAVVWTWWNHSNKFHKSGVYKRSIDIYWRFIKQDMRLRHLLDILSASAEYRILDVNIPTDITDEKFKDFQLLEREILSIAKKRGGADPNRQEIDNIFSESYARKAAALLHAHLMGMQIPKTLYGEYMLVLQEAPRLLDVMIDMTVSRERFWAQTMQLIQLKQAIIQGVWPMESHLKQLPHWTPAIDKGIRKKNYQSILALNFLDNNQLNTTLKSVYNEYSEDHSHLVSVLKDTEGPNTINESMEFSGTSSSSNTSKSGKKGKKKYGQKGKSGKGRGNKGKQKKKKKQSSPKQGQTQGQGQNQGQIQSSNPTDDGANTASATEEETDGDNDTNTNSTPTSPKTEQQDNDTNDTNDDDDDENANKSGLQLLKDLDDILPPGSSSVDPEDVASMAEDALSCIRMYPFVKMEWCARTYEEKEIFNEDIVKVTVHLTRVAEPWKYDINSFVFVEKIEPPEFHKQINKNEDGEYIGAAKGEYDDDDGLDFVDNELEDARRLQIARLNAPVVHVNEGKFPFRIREKW
eukprot:CAMPEP_0201595974 /NCGR_PEP_ID=MMETSP0190_2-20130828/192805_1 /ASSEMBLY_ACC=CAM_ASM_000263 /TAXON_ID=37353 /ORGANISM="Rosalina sp." /LENGTH=607 /DNA_ID=CAMNT_0048056153 /DNA_START=2205 /DNA_END=4025 /DNA_ORIENTATION=-